MQVSITQPESVAKSTHTAMMTEMREPVSSVGVSALGGGGGGRGGGRLGAGSLLVTEGNTEGESDASLVASPKTLPEASWLERIAALLWLGLIEDVGIIEVSGKFCVLDISEDSIEMV